MSIELLTAHGTFSQDQDGRLTISAHQEIPTSYLDYLSDLRTTSHSRRTEIQPVCSVPTIVVDLWRRQGFDITDPNVTGRDIVKRLRDNDLGAFVTTSKEVR